MFVLPANIPVTLPPASTVPFAGFELVQIPPAGKLARLRVAPSQTVNILLAVAMLALPASTPVTTPEVRPTVAFGVEELLQVPP